MSHPAENLITQRETIGLFTLRRPLNNRTYGVDIVAVHGLGGDWEKTWADDHGQLWLRDFLDELPTARVLSYGYDSSTVFTSAVTDIDDEAAALLDSLAGERQSSSEQCRPIIFVSHSLGGIIVKKAMILANERSQYYGDLLRRVYGSMFFGVPHRGSNSAIAYWADIAARLVNLGTFGYAANTKYLQMLQNNSKAFSAISAQFVERGAALQIRTFYESERIGNQLIVDRDSAILNLPNEISIRIPGNHRTMCKFSSSASQKFASVKNTLVLWVNSSVEELTKENLASLAVGIRTTIIQEQDVNQLHYDGTSNTTMVIIPQFREMDFQDLSFLDEDNLPYSSHHSSTFRLADVLQMLPGQVNHAHALFHTRGVLELTESRYPYRTICSSLGLVKLMYRFFSSISEHENVVKVRTTLGLFELCNERSEVSVHFYPRSRDAQVHPLAGADFYGARRFAQGMFRLSNQAFRLAFNRDASEHEKWQFMANHEATVDYFMMTPALDHPHCIRFGSPEDNSKLRNKRTFAQLVMNSFLRLVADQTEEPFADFGLFTTVVSQSADAIYSNREAVQVLSEAFWGMCTLAYPDEMERRAKIRRAMDDFQEMEQNFIAEPTGRPARVRAELSAMIDQHDVRHVAVLTSIAMLVSMNCSVILSFTLESPQLWIDIISRPDAEVYIA